MKNIKNILKLSFLLLLLVGCNDDEYEVPGSFVDLSLTFTSGAGTDRESQVNRFFSFSDISAGAEYQEWGIPDNSFFLEGPIPNNLDNHDEYIKEPREEKISTDKTVHVLFKKGDTLTKIKYYAIFPDSTSFIFNSYWDSDLNQFVPDTVKTVKIEDKWVAEYEFTLDVYDTVVAKPEVRQLDGTVIDHINTESITLKYGDRLVFEDLSNFVEDNNARPDETKWRPQTLEENEEDRTSFNIDAQNREGDYDRRVIDTISFTRLGEFRISLRATRERTENLRLSRDTILMPIIFKVEPLDEDLVIDTSIIGVEERDDDTIVIPVSSPLAAIEGNVGEDFTVVVDGTEIPVSGVTTRAYSVNGAVAGGLLVLTLDVPLEPADAGKTVTVSYSGTSIMSRDERLLEAFDDVAINVYVPTPMNQVGEVTESSDDKILIRFNQDIDPASITGSSNPGAGFIVDLNGGSGTVQDVSVNVDNARILELTLAEGVYQDDVITVAYTAPGDIRSIGGGAIADFTAVSVEPYILNLLTDGDFEGAFGDYWVEGASGAGATVEFSTDVAYQGTQSAKLTALKPRLESGANINYEGGETYVVSFRRYILSSSVTLDDAFHQLNHGDKIWLDSGVGSTAVTPRWYGGFNMYPAGTAPALDTWELVEAEKLITADSFNKRIRIQPVPTGGTDYTVYYDDFKVYKKDVRP